MSNVDGPRGLVPVANYKGAPYNGSVRQYYHAASDSNPIYIGDLVTATGASTFVARGGMNQSFANVTQSASGDVFQGVCIGVEPTNRDSATYAPASTGVIVYVADDPDIICVAQDINSGTALTANDIELNVNISVGTGNTYTGMSGTTLDNSTKATTNTLDLKILGQYLAADNDLGSAVGTGAAAGRWLVKLNRHRLATQVAGV